MKQPLRLAVILSDPLPAWQRVLLERIRTSGVAQFVVLIEAPSDCEHAPGYDARVRRTSFVHSLTAPILEAMYFVLEHSVTCEHDAFELVDRGALDSDVPKIRAVCPAEREHVLSCAQTDIDRIRALDVDVLLWLTVAAPSSELIATSRFGAWYLDSANYP